MFITTKTKISTFQPEQGSLLQLSDCRLGPAHGKPPLLGGGSKQDRILLLVPPPQDTEQKPQTPQGDQFPFTEKNP